MEEVSVKLNMNYEKQEIRDSPFKHDFYKSLPGGFKWSNIPKLSVITGC